MPEVHNPLTEPHPFEKGLYGNGAYCSICGLTQDAVLHPKNGHDEKTYTPGPIEAVEAHHRKFDRLRIEQGARLILEGLGVDIRNHNFASTPARVAKVYEELFCPQQSGWPVFDEEYTDIVIVRGHTFWTMCPHHLLPVKICANVAYFPNGKVIGASKLMRLIDEVNTMPLTQEKLTDLICDSIKHHTQGTSKGEAVMLTGRHGCFEIRGRKSGAEMVTYKFKGDFEQTENQRRFLELVR